MGCIYHVECDDRRVSESRVQSYLVLGLMGAGDLIAGLVCATIGLSQDIQVMAIVGTVLVLSGAGMLAYLVWSKSRPEAL
jgi:hydroxyethylthiazole kinase-like sugar kinase family protein